MMKNEKFHCIEQAKDIASNSIENTSPTNIKIPIQNDTVNVTEQSASELFSREAGPQGTLLTIIAPPVDGMSLLKPVQGLQPFSKRLTVRSLLPARDQTVILENSSDELEKEDGLEETGTLAVASILLREGSVAFRKTLKKF